MAGLPSARALFGRYLGVDAANVLVWNNSSLELQGIVLAFALLHGLRGAQRGWVHERPRMIVTVPGYDRHFLLLETLGFELVAVDMQPDGPDVEVIADAGGVDERVRRSLFGPTPPTGTRRSARSGRLAGIGGRASSAPLQDLADDA